MVRLWWQLMRMFSRGFLRMIKGKCRRRCRRRRSSSNFFFFSALTHFSTNFLYIGAESRYDSLLLLLGVVADTGVVDRLRLRRQPCGDWFDTRWIGNRCRIVFLLLEGLFVVVSLRSICVRLDIFSRGFCCCDDWSLEDGKFFCCWCLLAEMKLGK